MPTQWVLGMHVKTEKKTRGIMREMCRVIALKENLKPNHDLGGRGGKGFARDAPILNVIQDLNMMTRPRSIKC